MGPPAHPIVFIFFYFVRVGFKGMRDGILCLDLDVY